MISFFRRRSIARTLALGAVSVLLVLPASPAHAAAGAGVAVSDGPVPWVTQGVCTGQAVITDGRTMTLVVEGEATSQGPAIDTGMVCHVYVGGIHRGDVGGTGIGPAAAAAGTLTNLPIGVYTFCVEVWSVYLTGAAHKRCH